MEKAHIGLIGLAVMGANLARNIADKKYKTVVYNRTTEKMTKFIEDYGNEYLIGRAELADFITEIERPRKIIIMVQAGKAVDMVIDQLLPLLDEGDIIIDCGNSNYHDTIRRESDLNEKGFSFFGCGVSGGEEGALHGPSLMPGGKKEVWEELQPIFESIAAKDFDGGACVTYVGENGAGHYVKMVHNGIEYGVMQMMAEAYDLFKNVFHLSAPEISKIFSQYHEGKLNSYLFEIAIPVLSKKDSETDNYLIDIILDKAAQKGTGKWTAQDALERNVALPSITESVFARLISSEKEERKQLSALYSKQKDTPSESIEDFIPQLGEALYAGMISCYAQGYMLIQKAAEEQNWKIDLSEVSRIWEGGCIIRAQLLKFLHEAYAESGMKQSHLFKIPKVVDAMSANMPSLRKSVAFAMQNGVAVPALSTALAYFESMTSERGPANFIQGLRDFFGAHTYERVDKEGAFHTEWN